MASANLKAASTFEITLIVAIFAGWFIIASVGAMFGGFPLPSLSNRDAVGLIVLESLASVVAAAVLWARGWRVGQFRFPISWQLTFVGILLFAVGQLVTIVTFPVLGKMLGGADFAEEFGRQISVAFPTAALLAVVNGAFEEFFLARYLIDALATGGAPLALGVSALVRVLYHLYQGPAGAVSVLLFGLIVTAFYWRFRQIWPVMVAHMAADLVAFM
jgi:uncharacterized protein